MFFIGCHNFSRTRANEKRSFVLKNMTSKRIRASRIATYEKSTKYCKVSFIYEVFKPYTFSRKVANRLVKLSLFMFVLFLKLVSFYFQQTTGLFRVCILRSSKSCQP